MAEGHRWWRNGAASAWRGTSHHGPSTTIRHASGTATGQNWCNGSWPTPANYANRGTRSRCTISVPSKTSTPRGEETPARMGHADGSTPPQDPRRLPRLPRGHPHRTSCTQTTMSTGEPAATESGHGWFGGGPSERTRSTGTSSAAYATSRRDLRKPWGAIPGPPDCRPWKWARISLIWGIPQGVCGANVVFFEPTQYVAEGNTEDVSCQLRVNRVGNLRSTRRTHERAVSSRSHTRHLPNGARRFRLPRSPTTAVCCQDDHGPAKPVEPLCRRGDGRDEDPRHSTGPTGAPTADGSGWSVLTA